MKIFSEKYKMNLVPNTGHQTLSIPICPADSCDQWGMIINNSNQPELKENSDDFSQNSGLDEAQIDEFINSMKSQSVTNWHSPAGLPWLCYRFVVKKIKSTEFQQISLQIVAETNIGNETRGGVLSIDRKLTAQKSAEYQKKKKNISYVSENISELPVGAQNVVLKFLVELGNSSPELEIDFNFVWQQQGGDCIQVDLAVDLGNSRSVVLALEQQENSSFNKICRPIRFIDRQEPYSPLEGNELSSDCIPDSFFTIHQSDFADLRKDLCLYETEFTTEAVKTGFFSKAKDVDTMDACTVRQAQMFVEVSPAQMGATASLDRGDIDTNDGRSFLSSPKRYLWDTEPIKEANWTMIKRRGQEVKEGVVSKLSSPVLRYQSVNEQEQGLLAKPLWKMDDSPLDSKCPPTAKPDQPKYSRSQSFTWLAIEILETAYRQINSDKWRKAFQPSLPRRLRNISLTYPAGWTAKEMDIFQRRWQEAVQIFSKEHLSATDDFPVVSLSHDEGVVVQLPIIYSQMNLLGDIGDNWLDLYGKKTEKNKTSTIRIMSIDVGGGTSDIAIIEHQDKIVGHGVDLHSKLLFRDSTSIAGDFMMRKVLEEVLLPSMAAGGAAQAKEEWAEFWCGSNGQEKDKRPELLQRFLLPAMRGWLSALIAKRDDYEIEWPSPAAFKSELFKINPSFENFGNKPAMSKQEANKIIRSTFKGAAEDWSIYYSAFDVDMIIVSGKTSELPALQGLIKERIPTFDYRMIFAKDFLAGDWYPMSKSGRIKDAKTVAAVGVALEKAMSTGFIPHWSVNLVKEKNGLECSYWGLATPMKLGEYQIIPTSPFLLEPDDMEGSINMQVGSMLGRQYFKGMGRCELVYELRWKVRSSKPKREGNLTVSISCKRMAESGPDADSLHLLKATLVSDGTDLTNEVEISLKTMANDHWMDNGNLEVSQKRSVSSTSTATTSKSAPVEAAQGLAETDNDDDWGDDDW